jgi:archaellum component FlaC
MVKMESRLASKVELGSIDKRLDKFTSCESMENIETIFLPKVEMFTKEIDGFRKSHKEIKECVRKFDEVLSLKSSKGELST